MNDLKLSGTVTELLDPQTGQGKSGTWTKQEFILETEGDKYPKSVCIEIWGDKVETPDVGDKVTASINIESREYNKRWYTNVRAWKIEVEPELVSPKPKASSKVDTSPIVGDDTDNDGTLPF
jgi:hypothetical protein